MTRIDFHFNVPDKLSHVCRLVRKALEKTPSIVVTGDAALLTRLDDMLWNFAPTAFLGHVLLPEEIDGLRKQEIERARVWLSTSPDQCQRHDLLVSLSGAVAAGFEQYERLIEVVSLDDQDRQQARDRWRYYATRGYAIAGHAIGGFKKTTAEHG